MDIPHFLFELSGFAEEIDQKLWLVGGCVRDYLLGQALLDYDLACDEDAIELAKHLQDKHQCQIVALHKPFGTAKIKLPNVETPVDLATLRSETYDYPGALPKVTYPAPLELDLIRRDFTINALALRLQPDGKGELVDLFDGKLDLKDKTIRVLHEKSYWEDPTRIIRAARFATRFEGRLSAEDYLQIQNSLQDAALHNMIERVRGARVGIELKRLLELENWLKGAELLSELDAWSLCKDNLSISLQKPYFSLDAWQGRLAWILWNNHASIVSIFSQLLIEARFQRQITLLQKLLNPKFYPSLKAFNEVKSLDRSFQNLLFSLLPQVHELMPLMQLAAQKLDAIELQQRGFAGAALGHEMERLFQQHFKAELSDR